jgi:RNA polymerase sigma factor (TIGR02999 family)
MSEELEGHSGLDERLYQELRQAAKGLMRRERLDHTLQATALVHEALLRYLKSGQPRAPEDPRAFRAAATKAMRRILVDHARGHNRLKRRHRQEPLGEQPMVEDKRGAALLALDEALDSLKQVNPRQSQIVEMRTFGRFKNSEIAEQLEISESTAEKEYRQAREFLLAKLKELQEGTR